MNKIESRHRLIRSIISERRIHTQQELQEIVATICGDDVCLVICEDNQGALDCFEKLKEFTPPFFFSK